MKVRHLFITLVLSCFVSAPGAMICSGHAADITPVTIGTGGVTGVFYQAGGAVARIVNKNKKEYGIRFSVEVTDGSVYNIDNVLKGDLDFGFTQSDRQYQAVKGQAEWKDKGPQTELRSLFSLHSEAATLVASAKSGINNINDLIGKRVNLGNPGSGHRQNSVDALISAGINYEKDITATEANALDAPRMLKKGKIDAFFYTVGHPASAILNAASVKENVRIISMPDVAARLAAKYPYYIETKIPIKYYRKAVNDVDVPTFGVKATLVTSEKMSNMKAYAITKETFENFDFLKSIHIAFENLDKKQMLEGLAAPIHPGAMRYYKEAGLK
ncbi:TAXI family TRAP transporter solute-binding subunit [Desulfobacterales bacterium HSG16]|nr:TAXI family TRAP transporter solute-binding subunit [Desulfobacterales bacterium HSG16]